jgi:nitrous oxide reductase accessory protein NosL
MNLKKLWLAIIMLFSLSVVCLAAETSVEDPADCKHCGMNRTKFAHSRMIVTYSDGSTGTCSINCVVVDMKANKGKEVKSFQVGDYDTKKLIDAKTAVWVIGGTKKGVMTPVAKWAFTEKSGAEKFIKENGGKLATFDDVMKAAEKEQEMKAPGKGHGGHKM